MQVAPLSRRTWVAGSALLVYVLTYATLVAFSGYAMHQAILDILSVGIALAAAGFCGLAVPKAADRFMKWYWGFLALGFMFSAIAEAVWAVYELGLGIDAPYPSLADAAWLIYYPLALAGLLRLTKVRRNQRVSGATSTLDALLFSLAGAGLAWEFLMRPVIDPAATSLANLTSLAFPVGDLLLLGALASLAFSGTRRAIPRGTMWVVASFLVMLVADVVYTRMVIAGTYATGVWVDPLWPLSYALAGMGALVYMDGRARGRRVESDTLIDIARPHGAVTESVRRYTPYLAVLVAAFLSYYHFVLRGGEGGAVEDVVIVVISALIPLTVLTRQLLVTVENQRLQASLAEAAHALELRVEERTQELAAEKDRLDLLNQAAREISRCTTVQDVLSVGARLFARATRCEAVAVSASGSGGRSYFVASKDLTNASRHWLKQTLRRFLVANASMVEPTPVQLHHSGRDMDEADSSARVARLFVAYVVFPLISRATLLGAACLAYELSDCRMAEEESASVQNIASQIAVALENARRFDEARYLADSDPLTGLANHRSVAERLEQEVARSDRARSHFTIVMMDVDSFKQVNDAYGHVVGDQVLVSTSVALKEALRAGDILGRLGGDEFLAILPDTDGAGAVQALERIRKSLARRPVVVAGAAPIPLRVSCGVAVFPAHGRQPEELLSAADEDMYLAKRNKGDRAPGSRSDDSRSDISVGAYSVLDGLVDAVDAKDDYTRRHSDDTARYAEMLAGELHLGAEEARALRVAGLVHDVGKIGIPDSLLRKPGPLTVEEYDVIKDHSRLGEQIIGQTPGLQDIRDAVASHHERYDGTGYPQGLRDDEIPLHGRILAAADAYAAMTSDRPYHVALSREEAEAQLQRASGSQLDPRIVEALLAALRKATDPDNMWAAALTQV